MAIWPSSSVRQPRDSRSQSRRVGVRFARQGLEGETDAIQWDAGSAAGLNERDPPENGALVAALVSARALRTDQPLGLVETECRGRRLPLRAATSPMVSSSDT